MLMCWFRRGAYLRAPKMAAVRLFAGTRLCIAAASILSCIVCTNTALAECEPDANSLGVSRIVEIDTTGGPLFGHITKYEHEKSFLAPKEVVLTFDDGPSPSVTGPILKILEKHCTKATFFAVGRMAVAYPKTLQAVLARGHTIGGHTWSHPRDMNGLKKEAAIKQIERGFAALQLATGKPVQPFFRFPGLRDSASMLAYLQSRQIATFSVDVVSDDSFIADPQALTRITLQRIKARDGGIVLFHDIKKSTVKALPLILKALHEQQFKIVHLKAKTSLQVKADYNTDLLKRLAKTGKVPKQQVIEPTELALLSYRDIVTTLRDVPQPPQGPPVTTLAPEPRDRTRKPRKQIRATTRQTKKTKPKAPAPAAEIISGWATEVKAKPVP